MPFLSGCLSAKVSIRLFLFTYLLTSNSMHLDINISLHTNLFFCLHMSKSACLSGYLSVTSSPALLFNFTCTYGAHLLHGLSVDLSDCLSGYHLIISLPLYPILTFSTLQRLFHNPLLQLLILFMTVFDRIHGFDENWYDGWFTKNASRTHGFLWPSWY